MTGAVVTGLIGLLGVLVGSFVQRFLQHRKFLGDGRCDAYILFLKSLAGCRATEPEYDGKSEAVTRMIEAKSRIALFGSEKVVCALAAFFGSHSNVNGENFDELAKVIALMREDVGADRIVNLEINLRGLLLGVGGK